MGKYNQHATKRKIRYLQEIFKYAHMLPSYILAYLHNIIRIIMITRRKEWNGKNMCAHLNLLNNSYYWVIMTRWYATQSSI